MTDTFSQVRACFWRGRRVHQKPLETAFVHPDRAVRARKMDKKMDTASPPPTAACGSLRAAEAGRLPLDHSSLRRNPRRRSKHLVEVPADVVLARRWLSRLRLEERLADKPEHQLLCSATASDKMS